MSGGGRAPHPSLPPAAPAAGRWWGAGAGENCGGARRGPGRGPSDCTGGRSAEPGAARMPQLPRLMKCPIQPGQLRHSRCRPAPALRSFKLVQHNRPRLEPALARPASPAPQRAGAAWLPIADPHAAPSLPCCSRAPAQGPRPQQARRKTGPPWPPRGAAHPGGVGDAVELLQRGGQLALQRRHLRAQLRGAALQRARAGRRHVVHLRREAGGRRAGGRRVGGGWAAGGGCKSTGRRKGCPWLHQGSVRQARPFPCLAANPAPRIPQPA